MPLCEVSSVRVSESSVPQARTPNDRAQRSQAPQPNAGFDGEVATATVAINTLLDLGLRSVAGEHPVFVNMTRAFLTRELYTALPP